MLYYIHLIRISILTGFVTWSLSMDCVKFLNKRLHEEWLQCLQNDLVVIPHRSLFSVTMCKSYIPPAHWKVSHQDFSFFLCILKFRNTYSCKKVQYVVLFNNDRCIEYATLVLADYGSHCMFWDFMGSITILVSFFCHITNNHFIEQ